MTWTFVDLIKTLMLVTLLLAFKFIFTNVVWGFRKGRAGQRAPEDRQFHGAGVPAAGGAAAVAGPAGAHNAGTVGVATAEDIAHAERAGRVVQNDLENIPIGMIVFIVSVLSVISTRSTNASKVEDFIQALVAFLIIFIVARYAHSILYLMAMPQPIRTTFWFIGVCAVIGAGIVGCVAIFED